MKMGKKFLVTLFAFAVAVAMIPATAKAATYEDAYDANGLFFGSTYYGYESITVDDTGRLSYGTSKTEYLEKVRMVKTKYDKTYPTSSISLRTKYVPNGKSYKRIVGVKTSSKNLKAILSYTEHNDGYTTVYNDGRVVSGDPSDYSSREIKLLAKKAGNYTVTITVELDDQSTVTKTATVNVLKKDYTPGFEFKKAKYTTDWTIADKTVTPKLMKAAGCSDYKCYYGSTAKKYEYTDAQNIKHTTSGIEWKAFKPGKKKITLNTKNTLVYDSSTENHTSVSTYKYFYPQTRFMIIYKDSYTGLYNVSTTTVEKYKKL